MGTRTWSTAWDMTTDAGFRVCGSNISTNLAAVNAGILTVTADTGQINWTTVTKPAGTSGSAGYEIYKFTDSIGTLYLKVEYGTGSGAATQFGMWLTIGTGSNGSGTITGILSTRTQIATSAAATSTVTNYASYCCCVNGALWLMAGVGSNANAAGTRQAFWGFARTCDSTGALTSDGYESFSLSGGSMTTFAVNLTSLAVLTSNAGGHCLVPYTLTSSNYGTGGNNIYQMWRHEIPMPQTLTSALVASYVITEAGAATTTTAALVGSTNHTYFFSGTAVTTAANNSTNYGFVLVYE